MKAVSPPRGWFGDYVCQELNVAVNQAGAVFTHLRYSAMYCEQVERGLWSIGLSDGRCLYAPLVILAVGNTPRRTGGFPGLRSPDARVLHAWDLQSQPPRPDADVLIVGTGLSMVDALLTLERHDHRGHIHAVSRNGLIPQAHSDDHGCCEPLTSVGLRALMRELRGGVEEARRTGRPWQWRMDAARHQAQALWRGLTIPERQRFLRHARSYWDAHRHRIAPEVALQLNALKDRGRLTIHKGRIGEIRATSAALEVALREVGGNQSIQAVHCVISSLGFELDPRRGDSPLLHNLLRTGVARPGMAGLGLRTDELGRLQSAGGRTWSSLFALGSLRVGELWESIAAHEIQQQAIELAEHLARRQVRYPISV